MSGLWKPIASYGLKREDAPDEYSWKRLGTIMFNEEEHSCAVVTDIVASGKFFAKPFDQGVAPYLSGSIFVFNSEYEKDGVPKKKYDDVGHILSTSNEVGETSYTVEIWGTSMASLMKQVERVAGGDSHTGLWQNVHLDDREAYQPEQFKAEDENQDAPEWTPEPKTPPGMDGSGSFDDSDNLPF